MALRLFLPTLLMILIFVNRLHASWISLVRVSRSLDSS